MRREFAVVPPDLRWALFLPMLGLLAGLIGIALAAREEPLAWLVALPVIVGATGLIVWSVRRRSVVLDGDRLRIRGGLNGTDVSASGLDLDAARVVNLGETTELRPSWKTFGTSMPGFRAGHFRLRNRARAFLLVTDTARVLALPERDGRMLLLSLQKPQALLEALRAVAGDPRRR
ncbi:MAG: PH domain-containing protein [Pseudomonadota bacterium]